MGIIEDNHKSVMSYLYKLESKLDKLLVEKSEERKELNPENAEALKEQPKDYKLRPVAETKTM